MVDSNTESLTQHLQRIEVDGFTILPSVIGTDLIDDIKQELAPYLKGQHPGRNDFEGFHSERVYALLNKAPSIAKILLSTYASRGKRQAKQRRSGGPAELYAARLESRPTATHTALWRPSYRALLTSAFRVTETAN